MLKVYEIDDKNINLFNDNVAKSNSFLKVHNPMCGHCRAMEQDWNNFTNNIKKNYRGKLNVFNMHSDALPYSNKKYTGTIHGFPTIKLLKENGEEVEYNGDRSESDLLNFCKKYVTLSQKPKDKKTRKKSKKKRRKRKKQTGGTKRKRETEEEDESYEDETDAERLRRMDLIKELNDKGVPSDIVNKIAEETIKKERTTPKKGSIQRIKEQELLDAIFEANMNDEDEKRKLLKKKLKSLIFETAKKKGYDVPLKEELAYLDLDEVDD